MTRLKQTALLICLVILLAIGLAGLWVAEYTNEGTAPLRNPPADQHDDADR